ncbi:GNAT family N-acetyltransferase (plasmid) [Rhizobium sp. CB3171]|uniref:GNAT family N-acetyltransferase n=1 Tax=Rhizobium sp. CB3171 TaxID=3039157 RepID=UPI0024B2076B|nr:GNAT family N-acetyltransferase [Rhizobium sp. CB3171]WFU07470.1 GNAT family N-acetyltransferase [Rhizobium sp. CB3171]
MEIDIQPVNLETRTHFSDILEKASAWQKKHGSEGWNYPFDDEWMLPRIERGELFLAYLEELPVAAFRILWEDRPYWGAKETGESIYLHTFAVRRDKAGHGIGETVIDKIVEMGRKRNLVNIRLDCSLSSSRLIAYYERNGFASVGTTLMNGKMMNLMERPL